MKPLAVVLALLAAICLGGCKGLPGGDGQYATHDRGQNNRGSP